MSNARANDYIDRILEILQNAKFSRDLTDEQKRKLDDLAQQLTQQTAPGEAGPQEQPTEESVSHGRADWDEWEEDEQKEAKGSEIFTPGSTNLFSFFWVPDEKRGRGSNGTLFVTFKTWRPGMQDRINSPGAMYAYSNVPASKYEEFQSMAEATAGGAVWEYLRVRGSAFGHQHAYRMVHGSMIPGGGEYVPRHATKKGLRRRTALTRKPGVQSLKSQSWTPETMRYHERFGAPKNMREWRKTAARRNEAMELQKAMTGSPDRGR